MTARLMLVLMTAPLANSIRRPLGQPFGYVSAAEGFGCCLGSRHLVYMQRHQRWRDRNARRVFEAR
jgi:hypothetical protein